MNGNFIITEITPLGDPDSGESHIVTLNHYCKEGQPGIVVARFGKVRSAQTRARCPECTGEIVVEKVNGGDIFIYKEV